MGNSMSNHSALTRLHPNFQPNLTISDGGIALRAQVKPVNFKDPVLPFVLYLGA